MNGIQLSFDSHYSLHSLSSLRKQDASEVTLGKFTGYRQLIRPVHTLVEVAAEP